MENSNIKMEPVREQPTLKVTLKYTSNIKTEPVREQPTLKDTLKYTSNIKYEPVDDQPDIDEITKYEPGFLKELGDVARFHPLSPLSPPFPRPAAAAAAAGRSLPPPNPSPRPSWPLPVHETLPPRTARADFITPDQRAIFGPVVKPFERADKVKPDSL